MESESPRILVVDDEPDMCWALEQILRPSGFAVTATERGAEALDLLTERFYAAAFVDVKLPDLDGLELAALIRQRSPHTAVVLISGYFYQEDKSIDEGLDQGLFAGFVSKPFDIMEVRLIARQVVEAAKERNETDGPHSAGR